MQSENSSMLFNLLERITFSEAVVGDMASKSGGACDRLIYGDHFAQLFHCKITPAAVV